MASVPNPQLEVQPRSTAPMPRSQLSDPTVSAPPALGRRVLLTGGAGYIGSHTALAFLEAGWRVSVIDDLSNARAASLAAVERLTGQTLIFEQFDLRDAVRLHEHLVQHQPDVVVHLAGRKAVGESVQRPLDYYDCNLVVALRLAQEMSALGITRLVFSSSATVYGPPQWLPYTEDHPTSPTSPYGRTKLYIEQMFNDLALSDPRWRVAHLRYFNPVGAHPSGEIGEDPHGVPNNLMPYIAQVAVGRRAALQVFGVDYDTPDGTGVRDYLHVMDLAHGHVRAAERLCSPQAPATETFNLGTGHGKSVLELLQAFEAACGRRLPWVPAPRRSGDIAQFWADATRAQQVLGWTAQLGLPEMCSSAWTWQSRHPNGFAPAES